MRREEGTGRKYDGCPAHSQFFSDEGCSINQFTGEHEVRSSCRNQEVVVGGPQMREDQLTEENLGAILEVFALANQVGSCGVPVWSHRAELQPSLLDFLPVERGGDDFDPMAAKSQFHSQRKAGMQVAE